MEQDIGMDAQAAFWLFVLCFGGSTIVVLGICVHNILVKWNIINDYLNGFDHPDINGTYDFIQMNIGMKAPDSGRVALVTGGATVVFKELIDETLTVKFFDTLLLNGFSVLLLQCGSYHDQVMDKLPDLKKDHLFVDAFDFKSNLKEKMIKCRGEAGVQPAGVVISHAGTGTIADCAELEVAQIIVANPRLMDDHQSGFAQTMARERANIIQGHLGNLADAIPKVLDAIEAAGLDNLGPYQEPEFPVPEEDRMTFIDRTVLAD